MSESNGPQPSVEPAASRPDMPGYGLLKPNAGRGLLPWHWATERLTKAKNYWIASVRPEGRPHPMPVWGVCTKTNFYLSTARQSRKWRNLQANPNCVVCVELNDEAISLEGVATEVTDLLILKHFTEDYGAKYRWNMDGFSEPILAITPTVA